ncbi:MAG: NUDIX hydrolase [Anaerolineae bacterium]
MQPPSTRSPRQSAVLALLHQSPEGIALVFTLRPTSLRHHPGQISLPGGGVEFQDTTYVETALRETEEELGFSTRDVNILGEITPLFIAPSDNLVHPYVGWQAHLPPLVPDPVEVAAVLDVPLAHLMDPDTIDTHIWRRNGRVNTAPCYRVGRTCIWGATAMILSELLEIVKGQDL